MARGSSLASLSSSSWRSLIQNEVILIVIVFFIVVVEVVIHTVVIVDKEKTMFETHIEKDKFDKLCNMPTTDRIKLVYQWIKTGHITLRQFEFICEELLLGS